MNVFERFLRSQRAPKAVVEELRNLEETDRAKAEADRRMRRISDFTNGFHVFLGDSLAGERDMPHFLRRQ